MVYPTELGLIQHGKLSIMELDKIEVAGCIKAHHQKVLGDFAPFARQAYEWLHELSSFENLILSDGIKVPEERNTKPCWKRHLASLVEAGVIGIFRGEPKLTVSRYFAVPKNENVARSIFSGGKLSKLFRRPPSVNLPSIPLLLRSIAGIVQSKSFWILSADLRHFFHQIEIAEALYPYFTIMCENMRYNWRVLPMGFSYSPRIAQSFSWAALLSLASQKNGMYKAADDLRGAHHPPCFILLKYEDTIVGILFIWYDNFIAFCTIQSVINELSLTLAEMTKRFGFIWGRKNLWHPIHIRRVGANTEKDSDQEDDIATFLGVQVSVEHPRIRNGPNSILRWRLKPKTARRATEFLNRVQVRCLQMECREIAAVCGSSVWQSYIASEPLVKIRDIIDLSIQASATARRLGWKCHMSLSEEQSNLIRNTLGRIGQNPWFHVREVNFQSFRVVATDASLLRGAWCEIAGPTSRTDWTNWTWTAEELTHTIFWLELRTAVNAIKHFAPITKTLIIVIDNTAAAACLKNMFSSTEGGCALVKEANEHLNEHECFLIVAGIPGDLNDADSPTRGSEPKNPAFSTVRLKATWETAVNTFQGVERQFKGCEDSVSHWLEEECYAAPLNRVDSNPNNQVEADCELFEEGITVAQGLEEVSKNCNI